MSSMSLEERMIALEERVDQLQREFDQLAQAGPVVKDWRAIVGSMRKYPEFAEVVRLGREWRQNYRAPGEEDE